MESENEYLAFLIDTLKELPLNVQRLYQENRSGMLAFLPPMPLFANRGGHYSQSLGKRYLHLYLDQRTMDSSPAIFFKRLSTRCADDGSVVQQLLLFIPVGYRAVVQHALKNFPFAMTPPEFRSHVIQTLSYEKWLREGNRLVMIGEELDSILYRFLPLFPEHQLHNRLCILFEAIDEIDDQLREEVFQFIETAEES